MAQKDFHGIPTIDEELRLEFTIAYDCWRCPGCDGRGIVHKCERLINTFRCSACGRVVSRAEIEAVDRAEMRGDVWML